jgi:acyl dehydratase
MIRNHQVVGSTPIPGSTSPIGAPHPEAMTFTTSVDERYFEDYITGSVHEYGTITVAEEEMMAFARRFDPQPFHTDPEAAKESVFGGLIASGWFTASVAMRVLVDQYISHVASMGSPGVDELRWLKPVRPGDVLSLRVTLLEAQRSRSKPEQGFIRALTEVLNQHGEVVMTMKSGGFVGCRETEGLKSP